MRDVNRFGFLSDYLLLQRAGAFCGEYEVVLARSPLVACAKGEAFLLLESSIGFNRTFVIE